jgi:ribosomal protein L11 methyltransferase
MKWIAARVTFDGPDIDLAFDLVADIFYSLDLKGVVVGDPRMDSTLDWGDDAVLPPEKPGVTGYFADTPDAAEKCRALEAALKRLEKSNDIASRSIYSRIDEEDWAEAWKEYFWPQKITGTLVVKPSWRKYAAAPGERILEIDPGMAFGTGTHPTTVLCIRLIEKYLEKGQALLDVGTGSGILMIAAAKLGAAAVWGVDNDAVAVGVAEKNLLANGIEDFSLAAGNLVDEVDRTFDLVVANILAEVILDLLPVVAAVLNLRGVFICSGIIASKKEPVLAGLQENGFDAIEILEKETWVALAARRKPPTSYIPK